MFYRVIVLGLGYKRKCKNHLQVLQNEALRAVFVAFLSLYTTFVMLFLISLSSIDCALVCQPINQSEAPLATTITMGSIALARTLPVDIVHRSHIRYSLKITASGDEQSISH